MLGVPPETINIALNETRIRDAVLRSFDDQRLLVQGRIARFGLERRDATRVMRFHPLQRLGRRHILEPEEGIAGFVWAGHKLLRVHMDGRSLLGDRYGI